MKKVFIIVLAIAGIAFASVAQESKTMYIMKKGEVVYQSVVSEIDSIVFYQPSTPIVDEAGVIINGVKWATRNVDKPGAFAVNPEDAGMFYQWDSNIGWSATNQMLNSNGGTNWNTGISTDVKWVTTNDPSPAGWRVPTIDEIRTLLATDKVSNEWTIQNGITGRKFTDITTDNTLFLPAAGYRDVSAGTLGSVGTYGYYWSSTQGGSDVADRLDFNCDGADWNYDYRGYGFTVRSVAE